LFDDVAPMMLLMIRATNQMALSGVATQAGCGFNAKPDC
jgi:hypothetical protein